VADAVRDAAKERGIVLRDAHGRLVVVLPGMDRSAASRLVAAVSERLARGVAIHARVVENGVAVGKDLDGRGTPAPLQVAAA
jgi:hypothetical protein